MDSRQITVLPKTKYGLRSAAEKWSVPPLPKKARQHRLLLVIGSGRSGTTHTARLLQHIGLDVRHETTGLDGTASLFFTVDSDWNPYVPWRSDGACHCGERRSDYLFDHVVQIMRHPLKTIPSIGAIFPTLNYEFFADNDLAPYPDGMPKLLRSAFAWYGLNKAAEAQAEWRFQLERYEEAWPRFMKRIGLPDIDYPALPPTNKGTGYRRTAPTTWEALRQLDERLTKNIYAMARRYGYE